MASSEPRLPAMDLHVHTLYSGHSEPGATVRGIIEAAGVAGIEAVAITEHIPTVVGSIEEWRASRNDRRIVDTVAEDIAAAKAELGGAGPCVLLGAEIDADPYSLDGALMLEDVSGLDYVLASTHLFPGGEAFWFDSFLVPEAARPAVLKRWVEWETNIAANPAVDGIAHPCAMLCARGVIESFSEEVLEALTPMLEHMAAHETAFELNELLARKLPQAARLSYPRLVALARALGVSFTLGSDAHGLGAIGKFGWISAVAGEADIIAADFIGVPGGRGADA